MLGIVTYHLKLLGRNISDSNYMKYGEIIHMVEPEGIEISIVDFCWLNYCSLEAKKGKLGGALLAWRWFNSIYSSTSFLEFWRSAIFSSSNSRRLSSSIGPFKVDCCWDYSISARLSSLLRLRFLSIISWPYSSKNCLSFLVFSALWMSFLCFPMICNKQGNTWIG